MRGGVLSIGKFDGLHRGHAEILGRLTRKARLLGVPSVVFTFDPPPIQVLRPDLPPPTLLCDVDQKIAAFERFGPDALVLFPTTREFLARSAPEFFREIVVERFGAVALVEGSNFNFGRAKEGNGAVLAELCGRFNVDLEIAPSVEIDGVAVSSSSIRALIRSGEVERAAAALGRPYRLRGIVESGDRRGRTLGFPTANLGQTATVLPNPGVYAATATLENGETFAAAVNLGGNPTFGVDAVKIEVHLLDFSGDLYGTRLDVDFRRKIREVVTFASKDALIERLNRDLDEIRRLNLTARRS